MRDFPSVYRRELYDLGTDDAMQQLEGLNDIQARLRPAGRLLDNLLDEEKPFHETIVPGPENNPHAPVLHQVAPQPRPPVPRKPRSVLVR